MSKPDFDSGKGYYWMKQTRAAIASGTRDNLPHKTSEYNPNKFDRKSKEELKTTEWKQAVEQRLSRRYF